MVEDDIRITDLEFEECELHQFLQSLWVHGVIEELQREAGYQPEDDH